LNARLQTARPGLLLKTAQIKMALRQFAEVFGGEDGIPAEVGCCGSAPGCCWWGWGCYPLVNVVCF